MIVDQQLAKTIPIPINDNRDEAATLYIMSPALDILNLGFLQDLVSKVSTQETGRMEIDLPVKYFGEFVLHIEKRKSRLPTNDIMVRPVR